MLSTLRSGLLMLLRKGVRAFHGLAGAVQFSPLALLQTPSCMFFPRDCPTAAMNLAGSLGLLCE
jgi:hypothetical protein